MGGRRRGLRRQPPPARPPWNVGSSATCWAVSSTHRLPTQAGPQRADHLARRIPRRAWHKLSAGKGAKGHRWYDSAHLALATPGLAGHQYLLIRRNRRTGELAYYRCYAPRPVPLSTLVKIAGSRWTV